MKKVLNLRNLLVFAGFVLAALAFVFAFNASLFTEGTLPIVGTYTSVELTGIVIGKQSTITTIGSTVSTVEAEDVVHALVPLIGIIASLVFACGAVASSFVKNKGLNNLIVVVAGLIAVAAGVIMFIAKDFYIESLAEYNFNNDKYLPMYTKEDIVEDLKTIYEDYSLTAMGIFSGIANLLGGFALIGSRFIKVKKAKKSR